MSAHAERFIESKVALATALNDGALGGTYADAILILASALSALATDRWPGRRIDKARFVELCIFYGSHHLGSSRISVPLLADYLRRNNHMAEARVLEDGGIWAQPGFRTLVVTGDGVDRNEPDVFALIPAIPRKVIRQHAYATLFYEHVRSGLVHEYGVSAYASGHAQARSCSAISYVNFVEPPHKRIHFPFEWVVDLARGIGKSFPEGFAPAKTAPAWLEG